MADIVVSSKKKINLFDRVIQSVVIAVNMNKMNRAIDEHLGVIRKTEGEEQKVYQENILREIVFVKYQYDIMQREMYELKLSYPAEILDKINSTDKIDRLELQKAFLEMEYDRITRAKFRSRDDIKFGLFSISSAIDDVKQNIKDEGKSQRYNKVIKSAEEIDAKIETDEYTDELYKNLFSSIDDYVSYNLIINICKNSYRYFKIIDKIFEKLQKIYDESLEKDVISLPDYIKMYRDIYDMKIKTMVNDVHRTIKTEDEYLEYSKLVTSEDVEEEELNKFILSRALEITSSDKVKELIEESIKPKEEIIPEDIVNEVDTEIVEEEKEEKAQNKETTGKAEKVKKSKKAV